MAQHKVTITNRNWDVVPVVGRVRSIEADNRVQIDIDPRGVAWARIANGGDESVVVTVETES